MSHITLCQTKVRFMNEQTLHQALQFLGVVGTDLLDYYGKKTNVEMALCTQEFPRGIGFKKQASGEFTAMMDEYGCGNRGRSLLNKISQKYIQLYVTKATQKQGFHVQAQVKEDGHVKVLARRY